MYVLYICIFFNWKFEAHGPLAFGSVGYNIVGIQYNLYIYTYIQYTYKLSCSLAHLPSTPLSIPRTLSYANGFGALLLRIVGSGEPALRSSPPYLFFFHSPTHATLFLSLTTAIQTLTSCQHQPLYFYYLLYFYLNCKYVFFFQLCVLIYIIRGSIRTHTSLIVAASSFIIIIIIILYFCRFSWGSLAAVVFLHTSEIGM